MSGFDWKAYGDAIRHIREYRAQCSRNCLAKRVTSETGVKVNEGLIERIEAGKQPKPDGFFAINMTLFGDPMPKCLKERGFKC